MSPKPLDFVINDAAQGHRTGTSTRNGPMAVPACCSTAVMVLSPLFGTGEVVDQPRPMNAVLTRPGTVLASGTRATVAPSTPGSNSHRTAHTGRATEPVWCLSPTARPSSPTKAREGAMAPTEVQSTNARAETFVFTFR